MAPLLALPTRSGHWRLYETVALDRDNLESLYWAGWSLIGYGDLNKPQARLERVLTLAKTDDQGPSNACSIFADEVHKLSLDADAIGSENARLIGRIGGFERY